MKAITKEKSNVVKMLVFLPRRVKSIMVKTKKMIPFFLLFQQCYQTPPSTGKLSQNCLLKGLSKVAFNHYT